MKKIFILVSILTYTTTLFGAYDIKIGVYQNAKNLRANIAKIKNTKYRKSIIVEKKQRLYYAHAILSSNKDARNALHAYKSIFKDAFISKNQVKIKKLLEKTVRKISPEVTQEVKNPKKIQNINAQELLADRTMYLCYEKGPKHLKDRVVKMVFEKEYVIYNPLKKMSTAVNLPYEFEDNNLTLHLSDMEIIHNIYKKESSFLYAKSMIDGLVVNKLRYYFDEASALAFVGKTKTLH